MRWYWIGNTYSRGMKLPKPPHIDPKKVIKAETLFSSRTEKIITFCIWLSIVLWFRLYKRIAGITIPELFTFVYSIIHDTRRWPLALIGLYGMRPLVLFPPTWLLSVFIGAVFGVWPGILFAYIWDNLWAVTWYRIWYYFGNHVLRNKEEVSVRLFSYRVHLHPFIAVFITRLSFVPDDIVTYSRWYLRAPRKRYLLGTLAGNIFFTVLSVLIGASIQNIETADFSKLTLDHTQLIRAIAGYALMLGVGVVLARKAGSVEKREK